jgi:hypothetical protein
MRAFSLANGRITRTLPMTVAASLLSGLLWGAATAAETGRAGSGETTIPRRPVGPRPTAEELETWRQKILKTPQPRNGCFTAAYPDEQWHEVACTTPSHKLYLPKHGQGTSVEQVGNGPDFSATVSGHITQAEGRFDPRNERFE